MLFSVPVGIVFAIVSRDGGLAFAALPDAMRTALPELLASAFPEDAKQVSDFDGSHTHEP
jgi:hypothetical protein